MILEASLKFNINLKDSIIVGDRYSDILSGYKAGIKKYVHVSTPEVYGSTKKWIKDSFNFNPISMG